MASEMSSAALPPVGIELASVSSAPPQARFVLAPTEAAAPYWLRDSWPLGPDGNARYDAGVPLPCPAQTTVPAHGRVVVRLGVRVRCLRLYWNAGDSSPVGIASAFLLLPADLGRPPPAGRPSWADEAEPPQPGRQLFSTGSTLVNPGQDAELCLHLFNFGSEPATIAAGEVLAHLAAPSLAPADYVVARPGSALHEAVFPAGGTAI